MMTWLALYPPYLVALTVLLVVFPTLIAIGIRITLYRHFQDSAEKVKRLIRKNSPGIQPKIASHLEERFRQASQYLETVNTSALIDELYGEEKFSFLGFSLKCVKWDHLGTILPNLLLAFGLLGTFYGITKNLTYISSVINQDSLTGNGLIDTLQIPLQSMGIAFVTSLVALFCSSILTVFNFFFNANIARISLLSALEDYLDNIVQPTIEGRSRLDRAVNRMVEQQNEFLTRFHERVTEVLESSLGKVAREITEGNQKTEKLVIQVCDRLNETAVTLSHGGDNFNHSTQSFEKQVSKLDSLIQHKNFVDYSNSLNNCVTNFKNTIDNLANSKVTENLITTSKNLQSTQKELSAIVQTLQNFCILFQQSTENIETSFHNVVTIGQQIRDVGRDFHQLQDRSYQLNSSFTERTIEYLTKIENQSEISSETLTQISSIELKQHEEAKIFNSAFSGKIDQLTTAFQNTNNDLLKIIHNVNHNSEQLKSLGDNVTRIISQENSKKTYQSQIIVQRSEQAIDYLKSVQGLLQKLIVLTDRPYQQNQNSQSFNLLSNSHSPIDH